MISWLNCFLRLKISGSHSGFLSSRGDPRHLIMAAMTWIDVMTETERKSLSTDDEIHFKNDHSHITAHLQAILTSKGLNSRAALPGSFTVRPLCLALFQLLGSKIFPPFLIFVFQYFKEQCLSAFAHLVLSSPLQLSWSLVAFSDKLSIHAPLGQPLLLN